FRPGGALSITNGTVLQLVTFGYDIQPFQLSAGPAWVTAARFDLEAKPEHPDGPTDMQHLSDEQIRLMQDHMRTTVRALLAERFHLAVHRDSKEFPVYLLVVAKGGPKLRQAQGEGNPHLRVSRGQIDATATPVDLLRRQLPLVLGRPVIDRTGLNG